MKQYSLYLKFLAIYILASCEQPWEDFDYDDLDNTWLSEAYDLDGAWVSSDGVRIIIENGQYFACIKEECDSGEADVGPGMRVHLYGFRQTRLYEKLSQEGHIFEPSTKSHPAHTQYTDFSPNVFGGKCAKSPCSYIGGNDGPLGYLFRWESL
jgi:hypothetical protein